METTPTLFLWDPEHGPQLQELFQDSPDGHSLSAHLAWKLNKVQEAMVWQTPICSHPLQFPRHIGWM